MVLSQKEFTVWAAVFGSSVARQWHDMMDRGEGCPDEDRQDDFVEESETIADLTVEAMRRRRKLSS